MPREKHFDKKKEYKMSDCDRIEKESKWDRKLQREKGNKRPNII